MLLLLMAQLQDMLSQLRWRNEPFCLNV